MLFRNSFASVCPPCEAPLLRANRAALRRPVASPEFPPRSSRCCARASCRRPSRGRFRRRAHPICRKSRLTTSSFPCLRDDQHALLRFAEQNFVGRHARSRVSALWRDRSRCRCRRGSPFRRSSRSARRAHILNAGDRVGARAIRGTLRATAFSLNGSPTCTAGRSSRDSSVNSREANAAPARPSRPVSAPT